MEIDTIYEEALEKYPFLRKGVNCEKENVAAAKAYIQHKPLTPLEKAVIENYNCYNINPQTATEWAYKGFCLYKIKGDIESAIIAFEKSINLEPDNYTSWFQLGLIYAVEKTDFKKAYVYLERAYVIKKDPDYLYPLGVVLYTGFKEYEAAKHYLKDCLSNNPKHSLAKELFNNICGVQVDIIEEEQKKDE